MLRKLLRLAVFARDKHRCVRCGRQTSLAPSHVYPKGRYPRMQYMLDNVKTLCFGCHLQWWHLNPIEANDWFRMTFPTRYRKLKKLSQNTNLPPLDYETIKKDLDKAIQKYG